MSDDKSWQSPAGAGQNPTASPWAAPQQNAPQPSDAASAWQGQPAPAAWAPPPKPGLIPLRPLAFGTIMGSSFRVMRRNPAPTFGLAVLVNAVVVVLSGIVLTLFTFSLTARLQSAAPEDQGDIFAGSFALFLVLLLIPVALGVVGSGIVQGILSLEVSRATIGEKLRIRGLWRLARGRFGALIVWALITTAVLTAFVVVAVGIGFGIVALGTLFPQSPAVTGVSVLVSVLVSLIVTTGFVVLSVWLGTKTALTPSAIVLERLPLRAAIRRSWQLTRGNFWRTLGIWILIVVMMSVASTVVSYPLQLIGQMVLVLADPTGDGTSALIGYVALTLAASMLSGVVGAVGSVAQSSALAFIYIDIRMRKEGLDLELLHYVESKGTAAPGTVNPYERLVDERTGANVAPTGDAKRV